jgi:lipoprotein NlpI
LTQHLSEEGFIKAADSKDGKLDKEQHCEAYFYIGTMSLIEGKKEKARQCFQKCLETGVKQFFEYRSAEAELRMLEESK